MAVRFVEAEMPAAVGPCGWTGLIEEFARSGVRCSRLDGLFEEKPRGAQIAVAVSGLVSAARRRRLPVKVMRRKGEIYLARTD